MSWAYQPLLSATQLLASPPNAIQLDGSSQYGTIANFAAIDSLTDWYIEGWFKRASGLAAYAQYFALDNGTTYQVSLVSEVGSDSDGLNFNQPYSTTDADGYIANAGGAVPLNDWVHLGLRHSGSGHKYTTVIINGRPWEVYGGGYPHQGVGTIQTLTDGILAIGALSDGTNKGKISFGGFFRVWNRWLNNAEIYKNYQSILTTANESGLVVNCNFTEGSGTTINNEAGGNDISLTGSPSWIAGPTLSTKIYGDTILYKQILQSTAGTPTGDDAEEDTTTHDTWIDSSDTEFTLDGANRQTIGVRFQGITIPQGVTISHAYLRLISEGTYASGTCDVTIKGENADNSSVFSAGTANSNISGRSVTTASVSWGIPAQVYREVVSSPDIAAIIQEIINRGGWTSGNALSIIFTGSDSDIRNYFSADRFPYDLGYSLEIEYVSLITYTQTVTSKARIKSTGTTQTITSKARIKKLDNAATVTAKARIKQVAITQTVTSKARIKNTITQTITSKARIFNTIIRTVTSKARMLSTGVTSSITAKAFIKKINTTTVTVKARIKKLDNAVTVTTKSRIKKLANTTTITSKSRVKILAITQTVTAKARIKQAAITQTVTSKARIKSTGTTQTITSKARIFNTIIRTVTSKAHIKKLAVTQTVTVKARIKNTITQTVISKARIKSTGAIQTISSKARIKNYVTQTVTSKARIKVVANAQTITAKCRIKQLAAIQTVASKATIKQLAVEQIIDVKARISGTGITKTIASKARINILQSQSINAKARIFKANNTVTINAKALIKYLASVSISVKARIKAAVPTVVGIFHGTKLGPVLNDIDDKNLMWNKNVQIIFITPPSMSGQGKMIVLSPSNARKGKVFGVRIDE